MVVGISGVGQSVSELLKAVDLYKGVRYSVVLLPLCRSFEVKF